MAKNLFLLQNCKTVNLVNTLDSLREILSVNGRSHVICHVLTLQIFGAPKKLRFWQDCEEMFNWLNSTNWVELIKTTCSCQRVRSRAGVTCRGHVQGSRAGVTCRGHIQGSVTGSMWVVQGDLHLQMGGVITVQTLRVKCRCQLVVRLKANECYQELLRYLSSYINLLNIRLCSGLWPLRKCYWQCNHPRVCPDCIDDDIALIADLIANRIALAVLLIVLLWSYLYSEIFFAFSIVFHWPQSTSGLRHNSLHSWITHLHPIIHQDPSAKSAGLSGVTSRPFTLAFAIGWSWCSRPKR